MRTGSHVAREEVTHRDLKPGLLVNEVGQAGFVAAVHETLGHRAHRFIELVIDRHLFLLVTATMISQANS